ncbi:MAG: NADH-quinone oxidoreductase subunit G [Rhizobiales bacterium]|nr:NADH-quinone oxidoreductase subunit G [Hyphomicrobiales bacterium]
MPKLNINGTEIDVEDGTTVLQACEQAGYEIPRFCYHERLSIAGNCRMCLVEVKGMPKPIASCAMNVNDLRPGPEGQPPEISTITAPVKKAREGVMEFLLINHPLDCPICDQGGECDLQDQAMAYGDNSSRYDENKRAVEDKNIGPLIKTQMTRCIHCTRCVRFMTEIAGVEELGLIGRGEDAEITTYLEKGITSELSGNVIDLCPVGALTSKPFAFTARPWELTKTESIDVMDAVGSNIRVDSRSGEVMRIMPRNNDAVNEEWISDKSRFVWDGLRSQRLDRPYIREEGDLREASWDEALNLVATNMTSTVPRKAAMIVGDLATAEEIFSLKLLAERLEWKNIDCRQDGTILNKEFGEASTLFNSTIEGIDKADAILLIGANTRLETPVINARIRGRWALGQVQVGVIGADEDLTYETHHIGHSPADLSKLGDGTSGFAEILRNAEYPMIIIGGTALQGEDGVNNLIAAAKLAEGFGAMKQGWNGFNILHTAASRVAGLELGFVPTESGLATNDIVAQAKNNQIDFLYLLGADEIDTSNLGDAFVVYQGSHGDAGASCADVILPGAAYTEKNGTYMNLEGRVQHTNRAIFPPNEAKDDWAILRALSAAIGKPFGFNNLNELRTQMYNSNPKLAAVNSLEKADSQEIIKLASKDIGELSNETLPICVEDFYDTNPIARASKVMTEMSAIKQQSAEKATGTHD